MTKVAKLYEEEKQQAVKATAKALLKDDMPISSVMKYTGLSEEEVLKIQAEL